VPAPAAVAPARRDGSGPERSGPTRGWESAVTPEALRVAFDYRGDVTLTLDDGSRVEGYVANLGETELAVWTRGRTSIRSIPVARVRRVELSGRDTASGRSWETWLRSLEARKADAAAAR
jgi:hypothetical protein